MSLIDDAKRPQADRPPLQENPRRKYGPQRAALVQCHEKHPHRPSDEECPDCEPLPPVELYGYDSYGYYWP